MVDYYDIYGGSSVLHLWLNFITFMVGQLLHLWLIFITFMVVITFMGDTDISNGIIWQRFCVIHKITLVPVSM